MNKHLDGTFDSISQKLNTTFNPEQSDIDKIEKEIVELDTKKNELVNTSQSDSLSLKDKEYLVDETKMLIKNGKKVLEKLQSDIKIGSSPRMYEVYAKLMESVIKGLSELRDLNKMISDMEMFEGGVQKSSAKVNINLSGKELLDMINSAKEDNKLNTITTDFSVEDDLMDDPKDK